LISLANVQADSLADSIKNQLKTVTDDSLKVDILNQLSFHEIITHPENSQKYNLEALDLSRQLEYKKGEAVALDLRGILYRNSGFYEDAVKNHLNALKINEAINNPQGVAVNYANLGLVYLDQKLYEKSIPYFRKAVREKLQLQDTVAAIFNLNDVTSAFIGLENYDSAMYYSRMSLDLAKSTGVRSEETQALFNIAKVHAYDHNFGLAMIELQNVIELAIEFENNYVLIKAYKLLSDIYRLKKDYELSIEYGQKSLQIAKQSQIKIDIHQALLSLSKTYAGMRDFENAFNYQKQYVSYLDSLYDSKSEQRSMLLTTKYESEARQKIMQAEFDAKIAQQRLIMIIAGAMIFAMAIIFLLIIRKNKLLQEAYSKLELANKDIALQKEEIEQQKEKIHIQADKLIHTNASKDQIFNIISHDLRGPIESLNSLLDLVTSNEISQNDFKTFSTHLQEKVRGLTYTLNNLLIWSRSQMKGLTVSPKQMDLYPMLENKIRLFSEMAREKDITLQLDADKGINAFADEDQVRMVLRNLINNAIKFTNNGGKIEIRVEESPENIFISVKDNGVGISEENQKKIFNSSKNFTTYGTSGEKGTGIGLMLCKEIIEKNGGDLEIRSREGEGSTFRFSLPKLFMEDSSLSEFSDNQKN
jgi:signal transduction histidine kinase